MELSEIEHKIACNEMSAAQVFTQMKQHIPTNTAEHDIEMVRVYQAGLDKRLARQKSPLSTRAIVMGYANETINTLRQDKANS